MCVCVCLHMCALKNTILDDGTSVVWKLALIKNLTEKKIATGWCCLLFQGRDDIIASFKALDAGTQAPLFTECYFFLK